MIEVAESQLRASLGVERWVCEVAAAAPYPDVAALLDAASAAATPLTPAEVDEAVSHHPRIGEQVAGDGAEAAFSRSEQGTAIELADEIAAGNAAYEARFGRVFIIRAAGRSRPEILAELTRRSALDADVELSIVGEQLREIALLRLAATFGPAPAEPAASALSKGGVRS